MENQNLRNYFLYALFILLIFVGFWLIFPVDYGLPYESYASGSINPVSQITTSTTTSIPETTTSIPTISLNPANFALLEIIVSLFPFILILIILFVVIILAQRIKRSKPEIILTEEEIGIQKVEEDQTIRLNTLGDRLDQIVFSLKSALEKGNLRKEIIIEGYESLDLALKDFSSLKREDFLTPYEYALISDQAFEILSQETLINLVSLFYDAAYREQQPTTEELKKLILLMESLIPTEFRSLKPS